MSIKARLDLPIDLHKSTRVVVNEFWIRLEELGRRLIYNQVFALYALDECFDYVTPEDNDVVILEMQHSRRKYSG